MKTLLQINVTANWGSTGKIAEQIGVMAQENGWESYIAYGRDMNPSRNKLIKIGSMLDVYEHYIENTLLDNEGLASRRATKSFLKEIDKIKPDVVHLHNIHDHYLNFPLLFQYLAEKDIPVVWTQHDQWAVTGHCHYNLEGCERWKDECFDCPLSKCYSLDYSQRNHHLKKKLMSALPSLTIIPVSEWLADNMRKSHLGYRPIKVIHNGIDLDVFKPQVVDVHKRYGIAAEKKIVLGVASVWDKRKGLMDFYKLAERLPVDDYSIIIVGKVSCEFYVDKNRSDICQMIFLNRTQNTMELAQLYTAASVFVNSTYQDNYPTTNLEAMACGTPVITYKTGGSPEAVDGRTGAVVEQGDIDGLTKVVIGLASEEPDVISKECRKRAENLFDKNNCYLSYIDLYDSVLYSIGGVNS